MLSLVDGPKLNAILRLLAERERVDGAVAECGVYHGGTVQRVAAAFPHRSILAFDTFEGLPAKDWRPDEVHSAGDFSDLDGKAVAEALSAIPNVEVRKGYFPDTAKPTDGPFVLVHLDFDFYEGTRAGIDWFVPRMAQGGVIVFDDYDWKHCPGVRRAIDEAGLAVEITAPCQAIWKA